MHCVPKKLGLDQATYVHAKYREQSNSHAPNIHTCIIYIHLRVNLLDVGKIAHANANTYEIIFTYTCKLTPGSNKF